MRLGEVVSGEVVVVEHVGQIDRDEEALGGRESLSRYWQQWHMTGGVRCGRGEELGRCVAGRAG